MKGIHGGVAKAELSTEASRATRRRATRAEVDSNQAASGVKDMEAPPVTSNRRKRSAIKALQRISRAERQARVLAKAAEYFSEHGLDAQTRAIAKACGVSQRLLYSLFPNKAALIGEVYNREIAGIFKAIWFANLKDRSIPLEARLLAFYRDYYESLLTRHWLRLFLYSSLAGLRMAPSYTDAMVTHALEIVVTEAAHDAGRAVPPTMDALKEVGWLLHGAVSHLAIRRRVYANENSTPAEEVIAMTVRAFLNSVSTLLPPLRSA
ncbi:AcrR family transcriptional regulator [Paraburkholderia sp. WC7.3g]|uniref:TetR/AcrR family transcriptional regulator n=1 Tax=Paraburkholderia sp. WC7.3g TaxID=2991070 RepID=UPI003D1FD1B8